MKFGIGPVVALALFCAGTSALTADRFLDELEALPGGNAKPTRYWVAKSLDRLAGVTSPAPERMRDYLGLPTKAHALAAMLADHEAGFKDRLHRFGLRYLEFLPNELYRYDPATGARVMGTELAAFPNVRNAADAVWNGGDFYALYDFPLGELRFRGYPYSNDPAESLTFVQDWINKPFFRILTNSLTNKNRKRGAWLLRNFLCDDLSGPVTSSEDRPAVPPPANAPPNLGSHPPIVSADATNGRHASEKGCKSCHWKLDYVGAFFRYYDSWGNDYQSKGKYLEFRDQVIYRDKSWDDWMSEWRTPDGRWYAGVHRKALEPDPRDWDATTVNPDPVPADLFRFFKTDPDANRCLTRRMAEAFIGDNLTYDEAWLATLARHFSTTDTARSGGGFVRVLGQLAFSRSYVAVNPDPNECYDGAPGVAARQIPCGVYRILQSQCLGCHDDKSLGINLSDLVERSGRRWFDHDGADGKPLDPDASHRILKDRLLTADAARRMPYGKPALPARDLKALLDWMEKLRGTP